MLGTKAFAIEGGATTVRVSIAVFPVPPFVDETAPDVLVNEPAAAPLTFTTTVHEPATAMPPPVSEMLVLPAVAVAVPPQLFVNPFGVATTSPAGNVSVNATPASGSGFAAGLVMVKVNVLFVFNAIEFGLKALAIDGGPSTSNWKSWVPSGVWVLWAVIVNVYLPAVPAAGVPLSTPAPLRVTPVGRLPGGTVNVGAG